MMVGRKRKFSISSPLSAGYLPSRKQAAEAASETPI